MAHGNNAESSDSPGSGPIACRRCAESCLKNPEWASTVSSVFIGGICLFNIFNYIYGPPKIDLYGVFVSLWSLYWNERDLPHQKDDGSSILRPQQNSHVSSAGFSFSSSSTTWQTGNIRTKVVTCCLSQSSWAWGPCLVITHMWHFKKFIRSVNCGYSGI